MSMSMFRAFMELDNLYESTEDTEYSRAKRDFKHCVEFDDINDAGVRDLVDRLEGSGTEYLQYEHKKDNGVTIFHEDIKLDEANPLKLLFNKNRPKTAKLKPGEDGLADVKELSTEFSEMSVVDMVKGAYEAGLFDRLPVGRENAAMLEIAGVDKERLAGYFSKKPEFAYEINNGSGIISHEFISDKYDIEIFDSFISMYRIPQNESLNESGLSDFTGSNNRSSWVTSNGAGSVPTQATTQQPAAQDQGLTTFAHDAPPHGGYVVTIFYDTARHKLRAKADDGVHGEANVSFPVALRNREGQQYRVDNLIWNGKNYRTSGDITPISGTSPQNINENIIKEQIKMNNFASVFEELSQLYEEDEQEVFDEIAGDEEVDVDIAAEEADQAETAAPTVDPVGEGAAEPAQVVLECENCGALVIKDADDVETDDETGLANVDEKCKFCDEADGFTAIGSFIPSDGGAADEDKAIEIEDDEAENADTDEPEGEEDDLEEGIFSKGPKKGSADYNNAVRNFNNSISQATDRKCANVTALAAYLGKMPESVFNTAKQAIRDLSVKRGGYGDQFAGKNHADVKAVLHTFEDAIKELKKPASFYAVGSVVNRLCQSVSFKTDETKFALQDVREFVSMLNKIDKVELDKNIYKEQLAWFAKMLSNRIQKTYEFIKKRPTLEAFDQQEGDEEPIEEGIFDNKKRKSGDYKNASADLELAVEAAARKALGQSNKTLSDIAYDMTQLVKRAISDLRAQERKTKNTNDAQSARNAREAMGEKILLDYSNAIKQLKGVTNLSKPASVIGQLISKIVSYNTNTPTSTADRMDKYDTLLMEISAHESWKKDKLLAKDAMVKFYKEVISALTDDYNELKNNGPAAMFEDMDAQSADDADLEEGIFDSKAKKQQQYEEVIKKVFGVGSRNVALDVANAVNETVLDAFGEIEGQDNSSYVKNAVSGIRATLDLSKLNKVPNSLVATVVNLGNKYCMDSSAGLDKLKELRKQFTAVKNTPKIGDKAYTYLMSKVNEQAVTQLTKLLETIKREYGIV